MRQTQPTLPDDGLRFLSALWRPGEVREVRIPQCNQWGHTASGYFNTPEALVAAAASWDGKANIYVTLNPVNRALLARANNRIAPKANNTTSDEDMLQRRILFLDIDAERPSGISSTEEEPAAAHELLLTVTGALTHQGWPDPITCLSGNGYHALYLTDLPNTDESPTLVDRVLKALAARYDTPEATIDTTVANAARIACLIGTLKMKGDSTEERSHRRSQLLTMPEGLVVVEEQKLRALADEVSPTRAATRNIPFPNVVTRPLAEKLSEAGLDYREQPADAHGILWYHLRECPFHGTDHPYECGVGRRPDGAYTGKCFHRSEIGWQDWSATRRSSTKRALGLTTRGNPHHQAMVTPVLSSPAPTPAAGPPKEAFALFDGHPTRIDLIQWT